MTALREQLRNNPVFWIMWLLPASAVVAGLTTLAIAVRDADRALPASYHWEGERLDADFERLRAAAAQRLAVTLHIPAQRGECVALLEAPRPPAALDLLVTSGTDASRDRRVRLTRAPSGEYRGACEPLPPGRWRADLGDEARSWSIRGRFDTPTARVELRARDPGSGG